jgi:hypothetical protein
MNQQMGLTEFFAMEASEYLERLDSLVSGPVGPDRDELVRLARALRGSALMANQQPIGSVAAALENIARAIKEERIAWDEATRQSVIRAVDGLKILVRRVSDWGDHETDKAKQIALELAAASGMPPTEPPATAELTVDTGTRAFVAREGASVASVLDRTAKAMQRDGPSGSQIETVIRSMEPLRGLAALTDLYPLPEFLDGIERAMAMARHGVKQPNDLALFMDVAARGISKAAQEIATTGSAEPESVEAREFTRRLAEILDIDGEVVPIQSLYYEDDGPHVLESGSPRTMPSQMGQMEFVAHGEHLCQVADGLDRAQWDTQREIRTISLKSTLRTLTTARGSSLAASVAAFASVTLEALAKGFLELHRAGFIARLRDAGNTLAGATPTNEQAQVANLTSITEAVRSLPQAADAAVPAAPAVADGPISRPLAPSAAVSLGGEIPEPTPEPVSTTVSERAEAQLVEDINDLATGWATYESLRSKLGEGEPSIEELLGRAPVDVDAATSPLGAATPEAEEPGLISISELCYSGSAALEEAHSVRDMIRKELAESDWDAAVITDLIDELLDLVELGVGQT